MAEQQTEFVYRNIELYKSESLGSGSYGGVCKAKCDGLLCAAKIMHPTLFDLRDPGTVSYLRKFQEECRLLSLARHPNVVQYLATYSDPATRLPVLLMELCDESLTGFLERSPGSLPYHTQLNISHDIALALVYLHSNGLIHRDLTGNNVLMIAGTRAKITDFGMSKLASVNPRMRALTLCPGNVLYMSPEALDESKSYTDKLDIFSFGVLVIQILTRKFPNPSDRFCTPRDLQCDEEVRIVVPETQRRHAHLQLISDTHPLKPLALQCLKNKERERPSAQQLSERLSELKLAPQYTESLGTEGTEMMRRQMDELQQQNITKQQQIEQLEQSERILSEAKTREASEHQAQLQNMDIENRQLQRIIGTWDEELQEKQHIIATKEQELEQKQEQHRDLQQQKDRTISDLQQTISAHERKIQQLEQQERASGGQPRQLPVTADTPQAATASAVEKDITKLRWREGKKAPEKMIRGAAVVHGNTAYFNPDFSHKIYAYQIVSGEEQWSRLPDSPLKAFSLAVIDGLLTSVGGYHVTYVVIKFHSPSNTLLSLTGEGKRQWSEVFPPMPTARAYTAAVSTEHALIVAGGIRIDKCVNTVEVMDIGTKQWTTATPLPLQFCFLTGVACGDRLYLAGGITGIQSPTQIVLTCSLTDLLPPLGATQHAFSLADKTGVWKGACSLPVYNSTLIKLGGHLLAIGGKDISETVKRNIYRYNPITDSWYVISQMKNERGLSFAVVLHEDRLVVVGGYETPTSLIDSVEILE